RSLRRAGPGLRSRVALRSREAERPRRRHLARASHRLYRRADHHHAAARAADARQAPRAGDALHLGRDGAVDARRTMLTYTDSHCHLTMADAAAALSRAREQGVRGFVVPATKLDDSPQAVAIAGENDDVWAAVGFHPHDAK